LRGVAWGGGGHCQSSCEGSAELILPFPRSNESQKEGRGTGPSISQPIKAPSCPPPHPPTHHHHPHTLQACFECIIAETTFPPPCPSPPLRGCACAAGGPCNGGLTIATTHHSIMTGLKFDDGRVENASVEFDEEKLAPTYKLLWGVPGRWGRVCVCVFLSGVRMCVSRWEKGRKVSRWEKGRQVCICGGGGLCV